MEKEEKKKKKPQWNWTLPGLEKMKLGLVDIWNKINKKNFLKNLQKEKIKNGKFEVLKKITQV